MNDGRLKDLSVRERDDGIIVMVIRAQTGLQNLHGTNSIPVIMGDTFVAELIMTSGKTIKGKILQWLCQV